MITLRQAEAICHKSVITLEEVSELQNIQIHIVRYESSDNKKLQRLSRLIDKKVGDFFGL
jgi:hypothetical protein